MTPLQVRDLIKEYKRTIKANYYSSRLPLESIRIDGEYIPTQERSSYWAEHAHLLWMCDQVELFLNKDQWEKVNRWLGFMQGALWMSGIYSIDEMRDHNR
jgi:hypothetical protein